jgi:hypothetical protein
MQTNPMIQIPEWSKSRVVIAMVFVLIGGGLLRVATAVWSFCSTFDTATVGLMAVNILTKGEKPLFFYGQNYFGSIEAFAAALLFKWFGISEVSLSMAPILFSLGWVVASYLLFTEWMGRRAGLVGALVVAFPSFVIMRYCVGTDGGYPTAFMLGTLGLWICLCIQGRDLTGRDLVIPSLALGLVGGLGLWTHTITLAYMLPGAFLLLFHVIRHRFHGTVIGPFLLGLFPLILCLLPVLSVMSFAGDGSKGLSVVTSPHQILENVTGMFRRPLRQHIFSQWEIGWVKIAMRSIFAFTVALYLIRWREFERGAERVRYAFPLMFVVLFTGMYVINPLAHVLASRYTIPLWVVLLGGLLAGPVTSRHAWLRFSGGGLVAVWVAFYIFCGIHYIFDTKDRRVRQMAEREGVVEAARTAGIKSASIVATSLTGHQGQIYSFTSKGEIAFVNAYDERHRPSAELFEHDGNGGLLVQRSAAHLLAQALKDVQATWSSLEAHGQTLFYNIKSVPLSGRFIPNKQIKAWVASGVQSNKVSDDNLATAQSGQYGDGQSITLKLPQVATVDAVLLLPAFKLSGHHIPRNFLIEGSLDGENFFTVKEPAERVSTTYTAGNRVWSHGYFPYLECRFDAASVNYIRLTPLAYSRKDDRAWAISEIFVHEAGENAKPVSQDEVDRIASFVKQEQLTFVMADRWLRNELIRRIGPGISFPRFNPKFKDTVVNRKVVPAPGLALAIAKPFLDDAREILQHVLPGRDAWMEESFGYYTLLVFKVPAPVETKLPVQWYGSSVVFMANEEFDWAAE